MKFGFRIISLCFIYLMMLSIQTLQARSLPDFTELVEQNSPAVVKITSKQKIPERQQAAEPWGEQNEDEMFRHFFNQPQPQQRAESLGSGFVISADGYVLTNHHVINGADEIIVRLIDRREFSATVIGADERSDLALLKIAATGLKPVVFAKDDRLKVGEWVLAIGSPFGMDYSVTAGIVSAKGRSLPTERNDNYVPFIQTDVAINRGNSGGPLFNLDGEVVGINSQMYSPTGGYVGLSFAIPSDVAMQVIEQLKQNGHVTRGWLGVVIQEVDKKLADSFGLDRPKGALVVQISPGGPAALAGIKEGDIITKFDGGEIATSADLPHIVGQLPQGKAAQVAIIRDGKEQILPIKVGVLPDPNAAEPKLTEQRATKGGRLGVKVEEVDEQMKKQWNLNGGVVVTTVDPNSAGSNAGLRPGDIIAQLGYQQIENVETFNRTVAELPAHRIMPIRVVRNGVASFETIMIEE